MSSNKKVYIIDGYNVLRCGPCYENLCGPDWTFESFNLAREMLLNDISFFCGNEADATIVYDGYENNFSDGHTQKVGNVKIIFSKKGKDADQTVIELARRAREANKDVTVISSDSSVQNSSMGQGVVRMSSRDFCIECNRLRQQSRNETNINPESKSTIESSIPKDTLKKLVIMRDMNK